MALEFGIEIPDSAFVRLKGDLDAAADKLMLDVSDRAALRAKDKIRQAMGTAGLGKLALAITNTSDKKKGGTISVRGETRRASGIVYIRTKSPRTVGAIISYTEGAEITPKQSRWLWFPTDAAQRIVGFGKERTRLTPKVWRERGYEQKIGPLIQIKSINGRPLLAVRNVGVSGVGGGQVRDSGFTKTGKLKKGRRLRELVVMFVGIPRTAREARIDPAALAQQAVAEVTAELRGA
jgi:hypothetical protein